MDHLIWASFSLCRFAAGNVTQQKCTNPFKAALLACYLDVTINELELEPVLRVNIATVQEKYLLALELAGAQDNKEFASTIEENYVGQDVNEAALNQRPITSTKARK